MKIKLSTLPRLALIILSLISLTACSNTTPVTTVPTDNQTIEGEASTTSPLLVYGEIAVDRISEVQLDFPARISNVSVKEGSIVKKGDPLLTLNFDDYSLQIATLEKQIEGYELELKGLHSNTNAEAANLDALSKELALKKSYAASNQDPDILPLKNSLVTLNADLEEARKLYEASRTLLESGAVSQTEVNQKKLACDKLTQQISDLQTSITKAQDARALEVSSLQSKLNATTLEVGNIDISKASQISQLQVKIESTTLTLQNMKAKLAASYLKGSELIATENNLLIYDIAVTPGASVSGLGQPLFKTMDLNTLYVTVDVPEESLSQVKVGGAVTLKIADQNITSPITGTISRISDYATEKEDDTIVEAFITVNEGKEFLKPGLSIDAYIK